MGIELTYAIVEHILFSIGEIPEERQSAVRSRLRSLQRFGLTPEAKSGKGRPASYGAGAVIKLALAMELSEIGITPERILRILQDQEAEVLTATRLHLDNTSKENPIFLLLYPQALRSNDNRIEALDFRRLCRRLKQASTKDALTHFALINLTSIVRSILLRFVDALQEGRAAEFMEDLRAWSKKRAS